MTIRNELETDLLNTPLDRCVTKWVLDRRPHAFEAVAPENYWAWIDDLAARLEVDPRNVVVTGSGAVGVSLNPNKAFRPFGDESDIDVAVISTHHFDLAWRALRTLGTQRFSLTPPQRQALEDHRQRLVYWGAIATDRLLPILPFGRPWQEALSALRFTDPLSGQELNARVYRDAASLRSYVREGMRKIRDSLLT